MVSPAIVPISLAILVLLELLLPRTGARPLKGMRWLSNATLGLIAYAMGTVLAGASLITLALWVEGQGYGLLNLIALPSWLEIALAIAVLDFIIWAQHWAFHAVPWLWPLHRVHHSDDALDVTTAWRFHPGEIAISLAVKAAAILVIGPSVFAFVLFALILTVSAMFNHAHLRLPRWLDQGLSVLIVTPDAHRVHHGVEPGYDRTNFGFFLNVWDRLAGCYRRMAAGQTDALPLGTQGIPSNGGLWSLMKQPFTRSAQGS